MKHALSALRMLLAMTLLTGVVYPLAVTVISAAVFPHQAGGSLVSQGGSVIGSELVAQEFKSQRYFWARPSAANYNPIPSTGSNLGPTSADLKKQYDDRRKVQMAANPDATEPPQDLLFASGSGLDPHISPAAARFQISRVAKARNLPMERVSDLVNQWTERRQFGVLGEPRVNVLALNQALDRLEDLNKGSGP